MHSIVLLINFSNKWKKFTNNLTGTNIYGRTMLESSFINLYDKTVVFCKLMRIILLFTSVI